MLTHGRFTAWLGGFGAMTLAAAAFGSDLCDGSYFSNGPPDGYHALSNERSTRDGEADGQGADDVFFIESITIRTIHWYAVEDSDFEWTGGGDLIVLRADGDEDGPGTVIHEEFDRNAARFDTGEEFFELPLYHYSFSGLELAFEPGHYWFGMRPVQSGSGSSYWPTAVLHDYTAHWRSNYFGEPDWTPTDESDHFGDVTDWAFCISAGDDPCAGQLRGDANCNGGVDFDDIDCFVAGLIGRDGWSDCVDGADCDFACACDINRDGSVSFDDIDPFVDCVIQGGCE